MNKLLLNNWQSKPISHRRYHQLLVAIFILYITATFLNINKMGQLIIGIFFLQTILLAIRDFPISKTTKLIFRIFALIAFGLGAVELLTVDELPSKILDILSSSFYAGFLALSILFLNHQLLLEKTVTKDTILGGISIYLLIGILWYLIYRIIYLFNNNAFSIEIGDSSYNLLYFSFTTLTTLGYGDISPVSKIAQGFTNIEAIIGQLYPAIFLARLVSLYTESEPE